MPCSRERFGNTSSRRAIYRCPADNRSMGGMPVVRSYSMNSWMNGRSYGDPTGGSTFVTPENDGSLTYTLYPEETQIAHPVANVVVDG